MRNTILLLALAAIPAFIGTGCKKETAEAAVQPEAIAMQYGNALELTEETLISAILASPDTYKDKTVQVKGTVVEVCSNHGCFIRIQEAEGSQNILFKVEDGVIVFPQGLNGKVVKAEGKVAVTPEEGETPLSVRIDGLGAAVQEEACCDDHDH